MDAEKLVAQSRHLGRSFHADVFRLVPEPAFWVVMLGGSGQSEAEYFARASSLNPVFNDQLKVLERESLDCGFLFITAPFDLDFRAVIEDPEVNSRWLAHLRADVLDPLDVAGFYALGYSGGAALALSGLHQDERAFGASTLGGDLIPAELELPAAWGEPISAVYNLQDTVFGANSSVLNELSEAEVVRVIRQKPGGHALKDYIANGSWAGVLRRALRLWRQRGP